MRQLLSDRTKLWAVLAWLVMSCSHHGAVFAQDRIYRCGNEYTNNPSSAQVKDCVVLQGGNITVVQGTKLAAKAANGAPRAGGGSPATAPADQPRVDPAQQKARDSDARTILEGELKRTEAKLADLQRLFNNGQPVAQGEEARNPALYAQRVAELKASLSRTEADVAGIRRELQRAGGSATASSGNTAAASPTSPTVNR
jgi:hypothetical protein